MNYYARALELKEETVSHRRWFHQHAEVGLSMPQGQAYVLTELKKLGIRAKACGHGVSATLGKPGRCILLRADMDALPMAEESGLDFACPTGTEAHSCGHDLHAAMLLTAAKLLKENEAALDGTVKLMFQPGEETLEGARDMIAAGILADPTPDAALAYHVTAGHTPPGTFMYNSQDAMMFSADGFRITIGGRGAHGAYPHAAIDPIHIGCHVYLALEGLIAREADPAQANILTVGQFTAGNAPNIIPDNALLAGSIRSNHQPSRAHLTRRMREVTQKTAEAFGGSAAIDMLYQIPPLCCQQKLTEDMAAFMGQLEIPGATAIPGIHASASEDFAVIAEKIPSTFMYLSAGFPDARGEALAHNPKVQFNETVLPIGAAAYAHCATAWLRHNP